MTATTARSGSLIRERYLLLASLLLLAAVAWGWLFWQQQSGSDGDMAMSMSPTMGMAAPLFLLMWVVMMVAMMFPAAAPMILMFSRVHRQRRERGQTFVPSWVFATAYMVVWSATGIAAYALAAGGEALAGQWAVLGDQAPRIGAGVLVLAGIYQFTRYKRSCLTKCQTPFEFIMTSWREGYRGAFRMGIDHGIYCLGCCWMLFVILFPLGVMNIGAMIVITCLIYAERSFPMGTQVAHAAAAVLIAYGMLVFAVPSALPTVM